VDQGAVVGGYTFQFVAIGEGEAEPEAGDAGSVGEFAPQQAFRLGAVVGKGDPEALGGAFSGELTDVAEPFHLRPGDAPQLSRSVEQFQIGILFFWVPSCVTGAPIPRQIAYDHGFTGCAHWLDCRMTGNFPAGMARGM